MKFVDLLKGQVNSLNLILFFAILSFSFYRFRKNKAGLSFLLAAVSVFLLCSTAFLPVYFTKQLESKYSVFNARSLDNNGRSVYIHVLGAGYTTDERLSATQQLSAATLARLIEGIRLLRLLDGSRLITSGYAASGVKSLADVSAVAATSLGVDSTRIDVLSTPTTTLEEAIACKEKFGTDITVILVTDAIHMPRAMKFFSEVGFQPIPAPTNFLIKEDTNISFSWWPSVENMLLMDRIFREWFAQLKYVFVS